MSRRRAFNVVAAVSALAFVATVVLWVRSYWAREIVECQSSRTAAYIGASVGEVQIGESPLLHPSDGADSVQWPHRMTIDPAPYFPDDTSLRNVRGRWGFYFQSSQFPNARAWEVFFPCWSLAALTALLPALRLASRRRRHRRTIAGHCPRCGYDLRATPGRCPECGRVPPAKGASV